VATGRRKRKSAGAAGTPPPRFPLSCRNRVGRPVAAEGRLATGLHRDGGGLSSAGGCAMMRCGGTAVDELQRLLLELRRFTRARDWERYHDPKNLAMALASEAGELCDVLRWVDNAEADRFARDPRHRARIAEEAADVGLLLLMLCDRVGIDLPEAMRAKLRRNREKYPAEQWRGKAWADPTATDAPPEQPGVGEADQPARDAAAGSGKPAPRAAEDSLLAGIDAGPGGWVVARADTGLGRVAFECLERLDELFREAAAGRLTVAIDIPIGLPESGARRCDLEARRRLGAPRAASVFPPPCRTALAAASFGAACAANRKACGRGLTRQAFELLPRLRQVDALITPALQQHVREAHPEVTFAVLAGGGGLRFPKTTAAGRRERLDLLRPFLGPLDLLDARRALGREAARPDDLLDAAACLVTALRVRQERAVVLPDGPPERDARGLRMEIVA